MSFDLSIETQSDDDEYDNGLYSLSDTFSSKLNFELNNKLLI